MSNEDPQGKENTWHLEFKLRLHKKTTLTTQHVQIHFCGSHQDRKEQATQNEQLDYTIFPLCISHQQRALK